MNKNSNTYIIAYAAVMVVIVAAVLSFAALSLKGVQAENARVEKMGDILRSIGEGGDALWRIAVLTGIHGGSSP